MNKESKTGFSLDKLSEINNINNEKESERGMNFILTHEKYNEFEFLYLTFLKKTKQYKKFSSKASFFLGVIDFLVNFFQKKKEYLQADKEFIDYVTRKGKRAHSERLPASKSEKKKWFVIVPLYYHTSYINLMYSHSVKFNEGLLTPHHSITWFFHDFLDFLKENFDEFIKKNKRVNL